MYTPDKMYAIVIKKGASSTTLVDLTSAAVGNLTYAIGARIKVTRIGVIIATTVSSTGNTLCSVKKYPTIGSSAGAVTLGSLIIPTTTAAGKTIFKDITPVFVGAGTEVVFSVDTQASSAGNGYWFMEYELDPEYYVNDTSMVASA